MKYRYKSCVRPQARSARSEAATKKPRWPPSPLKHLVEYAVWVYTLQACQRMFNIPKQSKNVRSVFWGYTLHAWNFSHKTLSYLCKKGVRQRYYPHNYLTDLIMRWYSCSFTCFISGLSSCLVVGHILGTEFCLTTAHAVDFGLFPCLSIKRLGIYPGDPGAFVLLPPTKWSEQTLYQFNLSGSQSVRGMASIHALRNCGRSVALGKL